MSLEARNITTDSEDPVVRAQEFLVTATGIERVKKKKSSRSLDVIRSSRVWEHHEWDAAARANEPLEQSP